VARDSSDLATFGCPENAAKSRRIAGILRSRLARDMAQARSQDSSTFFANSADLAFEAGA
jgi:tRNA A37 methylthiotransferase MiaB